MAVCYALIYAMAWWVHGHGNFSNLPKSHRFLKFLPSSRAPTAVQRMARSQARMLREEQARGLQLAGRLQELQAAEADKAPELARLSEVAQSSTEELMQSREALQQERARAEALVQERAELHGKVSHAC
jgi:hypothetical protein